MTTIKIEAEIPAPPLGWEYVAFRKVVNGEIYFNGVAWLKWIHPDQSDFMAPVALRVKTRQLATPNDIGSTAFFKDKIETDWRKGLLIFVVDPKETHSNSYNFVGILDGDEGHATNWEQCEVEK